jgi:multiple sugar transport system permease protein
MITTALKSGRDVFSIPPKFIFKPSLENFRTIFSAKGFVKVVYNTVVISAVATLLTEIVGAMAAYSIARFKTGGKPVLYSVLIMRVLPSVVLGLPLFIMFTKLRILDTLEGLILAYVGFLLPNAIWLMIPFFSGIPKGIEEAAKIDGCSNFRTFVSVSLPLCRSGLIVTTVYTITGAWNHFFYALTLAPTKTRVLSVEASQYVGEYAVQWGTIAAISSVLIIPPAILIFFIQKHLVSGLALGGVKG